MTDLLSPDRRASQDDDPPESPVSDFHTPSGLSELVITPLFPVEGIIPVDGYKRFLVAWNDNVSDSPKYELSLDQQAVIPSGENGMIPLKYLQTQLSFMTKKHLQKYVSEDVLSGARSESWGIKAPRITQDKSCWVNYVVGHVWRTFGDVNDQNSMYYQASPSANSVSQSSFSTPLSSPQMLSSVGQASDSYTSARSYLDGVSLSGVQEEPITPKINSTREKSRSPLIDLSSP